MTRTDQNPAVIRTKELFTRTFFEMLAENPRQKIKISTLCKRARLSRPTFYRHYYQIEDIPMAHYAHWVCVAEKVFEEKPIKHLPVDKQAFQVCEILFEFFCEHAEIYKLLVSAGMNSVVTKSIRTGLEHFNQKFGVPTDELANPLLSDFFISQATSTIFNIFDFWVMNEMNASPNELAAIGDVFGGHHLINELNKFIAPSKK